jgi:hypothetical protein
VNARRYSPLIVAVAVAALLAAAFAPAPLPRPQRHGSKPGLDLLGLWQGPHRTQITPTRQKFLDGGQLEYELVGIDPGATPPEYDMRGLPGTRSQGRSYQCVYKVEGDTMTVAYHPSGRPRPTSFAPNAGNIVEVYKRVSR